MNHHARIETVKQELVERDMDAFIAIGPHDCFYLSGFRGIGGHDYPVLIIPRDGDATLFVSPLDEEVAQRRAALDVTAPAGHFADAVRERVADDADLIITSGMDVGFYHRLGNGISLHLDDTVLTDMRKKKDRDEADTIREAYTVTEDAIAAVLPKIEEGKTEREIAAALEYEMRIRGSSDTAFPTIVGTGAFSSLPHHAAADAEIEEGPLLFDIGAVVDGYRSDISRVFHIGDPDDRFTRIYDIVREAQEAAVERLEPGTPLAAIDEAARSIIAEEGYGDNFPHSTGHGVGVQVHEPPNLSNRSEEILEAGMVVTVEPGIYLRGEFGIRIEDAYYVTDDGPERLTTSSRDLKIL